VEVRAVVEPKEKKTKRGGRRPGAGAPRGNMNALKSGAYSRQFAELGRLLATDPRIRAVLLDVAARSGRKFKTANEEAAYLLTKWAEHVEKRAEAKYAPKARNGRTQNALPSSVEGANRLTPELPIDDWDSIRQAAADYERKTQKEFFSRSGQSEITNGSPKSISPHTRKPH
jgi:hypothetical protein